MINVLYKNHKKLIQNSEVYFAEDPKGQKILIGKVKEISLNKLQMSNVEIIIDKKHKKDIYETTAFVLMSGLFSENSNAYIVAISSKGSSNKINLKSGSSVTGVTFLEYKIVTAGEELKKIMNSIKQENNELLNQLEQYIDSFNAEAFQKKMDDLVDQLSEFSVEQKEVFKNDVLPSLRKTFDSMMDKLNEQNNMEKSKDLEKQLMEIEDLVDV
ncbi:MAG: hypothetical protein GY699_06125 [Desulfobacteraceae bacterium]|nr:hypothetical protein [Desulfobacteraceae bacterium]